MGQGKDGARAYLTGVKAPKTEDIQNTGSIRDREGSEMRRLRRSSRRLISGDPAIDARNQALVTMVTDMAAELQSTEHCQDMNEFYDDVVELTEQRLEAAQQGELDVSESDAGMQAFLDERMPLPARDGPACRDCGLCERLEEQIGAWLGTEVA